MQVFDTVIVVDWSAANKRTSAKRRDNSIWIGVTVSAETVEHHFQSRSDAEVWLSDRIEVISRSGERALIGFDFAMGYPEGFAAALTGTASAKAVWAWLSDHITDGTDNRNNRFEVANRINAQFVSPGPFWSHPINQSYSHLGTRKTGIDHSILGFDELREVERCAKGAKSVWMLFNPGSVGSQSLLGLPAIHRLSHDHGCAVWPFDPPDSQIVLAEVYPSLLSTPVAAEINLLGDAKVSVKDQVQVRLLSRALFNLSHQQKLAPLFDVPIVAQQEGWILGAGHQTALEAALR